MPVFPGIQSYPPYEVLTFPEEELVMTPTRQTCLRAILWVVSLGVLATSVAGCVVAPGHWHAHYAHYYW